MSNVVQNVIYLILTIFGLWGLIRLVLIFLLWYVYDKPIKSIHSKLIDIPKEINEEFRGRGVTIGGIVPQITSRERPLKAELEKLEFNRKLFLDRIHLIFSVKRKL